MLNHWDGMGRICNDLELKHTTSEVPVISFRLAVDRDYSPKGEEKQTDFISVTAWRHTAEFISKYFGKGRMIAISGHIETRKWTDKDGSNRETTGVVAENVYFADSKRDGAGGTNYNSAGAILVEVDEQESGELPF